jgi:hypothetical protein
MVLWMMRAVAMALLIKYVAFVHVKRPFGDQLQTLTSQMGLVKLESAQTAMA